MSAPRVFGYVRVGSAHKARVERWRGRIADYCQQAADRVGCASSARRCQAENANLMAADRML